MTDTDVITAPKSRARAGLSGMVLTELRALAGELGIKGTSGMRKGDLIAAIKERQGGERPSGTDQLTLTPDEPKSADAAKAVKTKAPRTTRATRAAKAPAPLQPVIAAAPPAEASAAEDRRDANDLARAAIERLRGNGEAQPRVQTAPRAPEVTVHAPDEPRAATALPSTVRPLPPPIMVAAPPEATDPVASRVDPSRPTPPAEIPVSRPPLDLRAEVEPPKQKANVAEEMLLAAKSMFHSVLPK